MHTIDMTMLITCGDIRYAGAMVLCQQAMPTGVAFWCKPVSYMPGMWVFTLKLDVHRITQKVNADAQDLLQIKIMVEQFLNQAMLLLDDFTMNRIDYDFNIRFPSIEAMKQIVRLLHKTPLRACYAKRCSNYKTSLYHGSGSRVIQVYPKDLERMSKDCPIEPYEHHILRQEVQVKREHIRQMKRTHDIPSTWDKWVSMERQAEYLAKTKALIPVGDFYSLESARQMVDASTLKGRDKTGLKEILEVISESDMETAKSKLSLNTYKKYISKLELIGINPITIPEDMGLDYIPFPLFAA